MNHDKENERKKEKESSMVLLGFAFGMHRCELFVAIGMTCWRVDVPNPQSPSYAEECCYANGAVLRDPKMKRAVLMELKLSAGQRETWQWCVCWIHRLLWLASKRMHCIRWRNPWMHVYLCLFCSVWIHLKHLISKIGNHEIRGSEMSGNVVKWNVVNYLNDVHCCPLLVLLSLRSHRIPACVVDVIFHRGTHWKETVLRSRWCRRVTASMVGYHMASP